MRKLTLKLMLMLQFSFFVVGHATSNPATLNQEMDQEKNTPATQLILPSIKQSSKQSPNHDVNYDVVYKHRDTSTNKVIYKHGKGTDGSTAGPDHSLGLCDFRVVLPGYPKFKIEYSAKQSSGSYWQSASEGAFLWIKDNSQVEKTNKHLKEIKLIKIRLKHAPAGYALAYRVRGDNAVWSEWKFDGEIAGIPFFPISFRRQIKQIQIKLIIPQISYYTINGQDGSPIKIYPLDKLIVQGAAPHTDNFLISVQKSDRRGKRIGPELRKWLDASENEALLRGHFDLRKFCQKNNFPLANANDYYRVKLATGNTWDSKTILIHMTHD